MLPLHHNLHQLGLSVGYIRTQLVELEAERVRALTGEAAQRDSRLADLREDIAIWRELYVVAGVTEIAALRAELGGPQIG
jgi:hypothetical protein